MDLTVKLTNINATLSSALIWLPWRASKRLRLSRSSSLNRFCSSSKPGWCKASRFVTRDRGGRPAAQMWKILLQKGKKKNPHNCPTKVRIYVALERDRNIAVIIIVCTFVLNKSNIQIWEVASSCFCQSLR